MTLNAMQVLQVQQSSPTANRRAEVERSAVESGTAVGNMRGTLAHDAALDAYFAACRVDMAEDHESVCHDMSQLTPVRSCSAMSKYVASFHVFPSKFDIQVI